MVHGPGLALVCKIGRCSNKHIALCDEVALKGCVCCHVLQGDEESEDSEDDPSMEGFLDTSDFYKMVFVINSQLKMGVGKVAAQVGHASVGLYKLLASNQQKNGEMLLQWEQFG